MRWLILVSFVSIVSCSDPVKPYSSAECVKQLDPGTDTTNEPPTEYSALEKLLVDILESFRQDMVTGSGPLPVLDPFHLSHLYLDGAQLNFPGSFVEINNLGVNNISTFVIHRLSFVRPSFFQLRFKLDLDLYIPVIEVPLGSYDIFLDVLGFNVFGAGNIRLKIKCLRIKVDMVLGTTIRLSGIFLDIRESNVKVFLGGLEAGLTGIFHDELANNFVNSFLEHFVPTFLEVYQDEISTIVGEAIQDIGNDILSDINVISIIGSAQ